MVLIPARMCIVKPNAGTPAFSLEFMPYLHEEKIWVSGGANKIQWETEAHSHNQIDIKAIEM